tara:strand:+ start:493 stop:669 length:177 start_codon:yes stop_codon:yes gene_type:complete
MKDTGLEETIFDYYLNLTSGDEAKDTEYTKALDNSNMNITTGNVTPNQPDFELESINE